MGWTFIRGATRQDIIGELLQTSEDESGKSTVLAHCLRDNVLWSVWEFLDKKANQTLRIICCDLIEKDNRCGWGYKRMEESMHPLYYTCPLSYLNRVTDEKVICPEWRTRVHEYHRWEKARVGG